MRRKQRGKGDPLEHEIESALNPGAFITDRACFSFVSDLDEVAARIGKIAETDPTRAVTLYETFLAGSHEKAEEIDDSSGNPDGDGSFNSPASSGCNRWPRCRITAPRKQR